VPLNAWVIQFWNTKKKRTDHIVLVTTDLELNAPWIVRHYEERPEIEQDDEQMKSGDWQLKKLSSTRESEIVFYVLTVVLISSLYHLFANTQAGARCADKTRQAIAFDQLRTQRTHSIVYAGGYFAIFETLSFVQMVLQLSPPVRAPAHVAGRASQPNSKAGVTFSQRSCARPPQGPPRRKPSVAWARHVGPCARQEGDSGVCPVNCGSRGVSNPSCASPNGNRREKRT